MDKDTKKLNKLLTFAEDAGLAIFDEIQEINDGIEEFNETFAGVDLSGIDSIQGEKGEKGDQGIPGKDGATGPKGPAGERGPKGYDGYDGIDGKPGPQGPAGKDGKDGGADAPEVIRMKLETLKGEERLDAFAIKNLPKFIKDKVASDGYPKGWPQPAGAMTYRLNGAQVGRGNILNITGTGITATPLDDGITYNITGGGGGGGITQLTNDVLAGPGAGSQVALVVGLRGMALDASIGTPALNDVITYDGTNWTANPAPGSSPITIENGNSLFSTGLAGLWNSTATLSIIFGANAGDNADAATSLIALGELAGASDDIVPYIPDYATMIGNRSGYNAANAIDATFIGHLAGAYAVNASYSFFAGAQAGISATYAGNSFMFGQAAGHNATNAAYSTFMGLEAGYDSTNGGFSNFIGNLSGFQATNANNATFIGSQSGRADTVNNAGTITYNTASGVFTPVAVLTTPSGGRAYVITDNGAGTVTVMDSTGTFNPGETVTEFPSGETAIVVTYTPSTSSILIGDHTSTGGGVNSVAIGAHASNAGFANSIVIGVGGLNTMSNQYAWGDDIINWRFSGNNYILPTIAPSGFGGQFLGVGVGNQLSWEVPGAAGNSTSVLAATLAVLPFTPTYANGAAGVGATLTATSFGALVVDGVTIPLNGRVLVKDQVATLENGIYQLSTVGTGGVFYELTRTVDADQPADFNDQVAIPSQGTQSATPFAEQNFVTTIGTDPIVYSPQASLFVRQEAAGTQYQYNIPYYTATGLTISKGTPDFAYKPSPGVLIVGDSSLVNTIITQQGPSYAGITTATQNVVIGGLAATSLSTGLSNTLIGFQSGGSVSTGSGNTFIGQSAGGNNNGSFNVAIGENSDAATFTGSVAIGWGATNTANNELVIGSTSQHIETATFFGTGAFTPQVGTTGERPGVPVAGMIRFNTTTSKHEGYDGAVWNNFY